jgi:hypothetical protein
MTTPRRTEMEDVLAAARRLPRKAQTELAAELLREPSVPSVGAPPEPALEVLHGLSETELVTLSSAVVAPGQQRRMRSLLRKNRRSELSDGERRELDGLLEEVDRVALLKAKAAYTLAQLGRSRTAAA